MNDLLGKIRFEADKGKGGDLPVTKEPNPAPTFDTWYEGQDDTVKGLIEGHVGGLKSALGTERDARGKAEEGLLKVAGKLEKGSEAQKEVLRLADVAASANTKADFYEIAQAAGVSNLKLGYHVAVTDELIDKRGNVNFEKMKETYPELFAKAPKTPSADAGAGKGDGITPAGGMNAFIRQGSGRQ